VKKRITRILKIDQNNDFSLSRNFSIHIGDSLFFNNKAIYGGAIFVDGVSVLLSKSILSNNTATTKGGAMYFVN